MNPPAPRRTCPACARRYAGLIEPDCPVCSGVGVLQLGQAALAHYDTPAVARSVELYLEHHAQQVRRELPLGQHRAALEAAVDNLRVAGVLATIHDSTAPPARPNTPRDTAHARIAELDAHRATRTLTGHPVTTTVLTALASPPLADLHQARPIGAAPTASATGHRAALHTIANPIDALGPDTTALQLQTAAWDHRATVIAHATTTAANRRRRTR